MFIAEFFGSFFIFCIHSFKYVVRGRSFVFHIFVNSFTDKAVVVGWLHVLATHTVLINADSVLALLLSVVIVLVAVVVAAAC